MGTPTLCNGWYILQSLAPNVKTAPEFVVYVLYNTGTAASTQASTPLPGNNNNYWFGSSPSGAGQFCSGIRAVDPKNTTGYFILAACYGTDIKEVTSSDSNVVITAINPPNSPLPNWLVQVTDSNGISQTCDFNICNNDPQIVITPTGS